MKKIFLLILICVMVGMGGTLLQAKGMSRSFSPSLQQLTYSLEQAVRDVLPKRSSSLQSKQDALMQFFPKILLHFSEKHPSNTVIDNFGEIYNQVVYEKNEMTSQILGYYFRVTENENYYYYYVEISIKPNQELSLLPIEFLNQEPVEEGLSGNDLFVHLFELKMSLLETPCEESKVFLPSNALKTFAKMTPLGNLVRINKASIQKHYRSIKKYKSEVLELKVEYTEKENTVKEGNFKLFVPIRSKQIFYYQPELIEL